MSERVTAYCLFPDCRAYSFGMTPEILQEHTSAMGWEHTPVGWVCPTHARVEKARAYFHVSPGDYHERLEEGIKIGRAETGWEYGAFLPLADGGERQTRQDIGEEYIEHYRREGMVIRRRRRAGQWEDFK